MSKIWRLNMKTDGARKYGQQKLFDFCKNENIIGIGWSMPNFIEGLDEKIEDVKQIKDYIRNLQKEQKKKTKGFSTASNVIVDRMNPGDFVWTRVDGTYKIAKILSEAKYMKKKSEYKKFDIGFYREAEYCERDFSLSEVPGKIIASFSARSSTQQVHDDNDKIYEYTNAIFNGVENYKIALEDWSKFFSAEDVEEIIGLYLQIEKSLYVYTSTNKKSTDKIEFELIDEKGQLYGVQVKTGHIQLNGKDYQKLSERMKVFLFATSDKVDINENENIIHIKVKNVSKFIKEKKHLLPERIKTWIE